MDDANHQIKIEKELNKLKAEIYVKQSFVIKTFEKILELLTLFRQEDQTQFIYLNRYPIQVILLNEDQIIKINQENINYNGIKSLFYLGLAINNDRYEAKVNGNTLIISRTNKKDQWDDGWFGDTSRFTRYSY